MTVLKVEIQNEANESAEIVAMEEPGSVPLQSIFGSTILSTAAVMSQLVVIVIAAGLEGDFSAKTIMWFQAAAEIVKRIMTIYFALCGTIAPQICPAISIKAVCNISVYIVFLIMLTPDWLTVLVAIDRLIAVVKGPWYKLNCTVRSAWIPIAVLMAGLAIIGTPRLFLTTVTFRDSCVIENFFVRELIPIMGIVALVLVAALTAVLFCAMRKTKFNSKESRYAKSVTAVLLINCILFVVFSTVQYSLLVFIGVVQVKIENNPEDEYFKKVNNQLWVLTGAMLSLGAVGTAVRGPLYLLMGPMKDAFKRTVRRICAI